MRTLHFLLAALLFVTGGDARCLAQPTGPATLENLLTADEGEGASAAPAAADSAKRPAGTVTRPKDGLQHPDLDKAWAEYDAAIERVCEGLRAAISERFDAATAVGDLDAAEKWQAVLQKFEQAGEVPAEPETKPAMAILFGTGFAHQKPGNAGKLGASCAMVVGALSCSAWPRAGSERSVIRTSRG